MIILRCAAGPFGCLTLSPALAVLATSGLGVRAESSAERGWQTSWMGSCPDDASDLGVPALIVRAKTNQKGFFDMTISIIVVRAGRSDLFGDYSSAVCQMLHPLLAAHSCQLTRTKQGKGGHNKSFNFLFFQIFQNKGQ